MPEISQPVISQQKTGQLEIDQLEFSYTEDSATRMQFDLSVSAGEILSLIGPSGSGKSTLLNLIAGFLLPLSGRVKLDDVEIQQLPVAARPVSIVFQQYNLFPHLDVYTNVALGIDPALRLSSEQTDAVNKALDRMGLGSMQHRKPGELSGGQRQRVALARVLVRQRKILLLDEAFAALGPALRTELIELVKELVRENAMYGILVSHQPRDAQIASSRTAFVDEGRVLALKPTDSLLNGPGLPRIREYLGKA